MRIRFIKPLPWLSSPTLCFIFQWRKTTLRSSLEQMSSNIEKVGQSLGRSNFYIFRTLVIPAMLPGIAAAFALVFLNLMKELTATLLLTPNDIKTLSTAVWNIL